MPSIRGYNFPPDLLYDVPNHCWYRREADGSVTLGMTEIAVALAGDILAYTPKRVGLAVEPGRSCAVIESGKWVGPVRAAIAGDIIAINEALIDTPRLANQSPYGAGWITRLRPHHPPDLDILASGDAVAVAYSAWMAAEDFPPRDET